MLRGGGRQGHRAGSGTTCGEVEESMGILSGLKSLGLGNLEDVSLFEEPKKKEAEKQEQAELRQEYIEAVRMNLRGQLDRIDVQEADGTITNLGEKYGKKRD